MSDLVINSDSTNIDSLSELFVWGLEIVCHLDLTYVLAEI